MSKVSHTGGNSLFAKADPKARGKVGYKKKSERKFGDFRLDYLRACKHDFDVKPEHCPFCIMVNVSVKKILQEEEAVAKQRRVTSIINRAKLRYGLLDYWSRSQQSGFSDVILGYVAEITLSGRAVTALDNGFGGNEMPIPDRSDVLKILKRRKRVVAIGKYAATLIQAKLRQHFACIRVRRMLLARFEYVQPRNKKDNTPYFYDKQKQVMWQRLPLLVAADRPASPSTMARRLGGEERKRTERFHRGRFILQKTSYEDLWKYEDALVSRAKQLAITRDVLLAAFANLREWGAKQAKIAALATFGSKADGSADETGSPENKFLLSLTGSAPSSRSIGLSIVLAEGPLDEAFFRTGAAINTRPAPTVNPGPNPNPRPAPSAQAKEEGQGRPMQTQRERAREVKERQAAAAAAAAEEEEGPARLSANDLLVKLEALMLDRLVVASPEEALQRLFCPDLLPAMMSAVNFSEGNDTYDD